jgi:hypothetical protein
MQSENTVKNIPITILVFTLFGCSSFPATAQLCLGNSNLPANLENEFEPIEDPLLLNGALGSPNKGKLCQGQVYKSKEDTQITIFRAWNSTNPSSKFGEWWAFHQPTGKISRYRSEYEICYQWSPLDKLVSCTLKPGVKVVVGTGQSAECSEYLTYSVSEKQQIFIEDASTSVTNCTMFEGEFSWK